MVNRKRVGLLNGGPPALVCSCPPVPARRAVPNRSGDELQALVVRVPLDPFFPPSLPVFARSRSWRFLLSESLLSHGGHSPDSTIIAAQAAPHKVGPRNVTSGAADLRTVPLGPPLRRRRTKYVATLAHFRTYTCHSPKNYMSHDRWETLQISVCDFDLSVRKSPCALSEALWSLYRNLVPEARTGRPGERQLFVLLGWLCTPGERFMHVAASCPR